MVTFLRLLYGLAGFTAIGSAVLFLLLLLAKAYDEYGGFLPFMQTHWVLLFFGTGFGAAIHFLGTWLVGELATLRLVLFAGRIVLFPVAMLEIAIMPQNMRRQILLGELDDQNVSTNDTSGSSEHLSKYEQDRLRKLELAQAKKEKEQETLDENTRVEARKEAVRFHCQLAFNAYENRLAGKFSEQQLKDYFATYMSRASLEEVTARGQQLENLIRELAGVSDTGEPSLNPYESVLSRHQRDVLNAKAAIDDPNVLEAVLADLEYRKDQEIMRLTQSE